MKIIEAIEFRSKDRKINESCDMMKVTIQMSKHEYYELLSDIKKQSKG